MTKHNDQERALFEQFCSGFHRGSSLEGEIHNDTRYPALNGQWIYDDWHVQSAWATWQARAQCVRLLADAPPAAQDVNGLVEALEQISSYSGDVAHIADEALAVYRSQAQGVDV